MELIALGQPGGVYEATANIVKSAIDTSNIKYMDSIDTALLYAKNKEALIIYTNWDAISEPHPDLFVSWIISGYDSILAMPGKSLNHLLVDNSPIGTYYHPSRIKILREQLKEMGLSNPNIVPYSCFAEMKTALQSSNDIQFLYGNSVNIYKSIGAVELITSRPDPLVTHFNTRIDKQKLANSKTRFGLIGTNVNIEKIKSELHKGDFSKILDRGYITDIDFDFNITTF